MIFLLFLYVNLSKLAGLQSFRTYNHGTDPQVACMAVSGNDVYIDGADVYAAANIVVNGTNAPAIWKNGVETVLSSKGSANWISVQ